MLLQAAAVAAIMDTNVSATETDRPYVVTY